MDVLPQGPSRPPPRRFRVAFLDSHPETPTAMTFRFSTRGTNFQYLSNQAVRLVLPGVQDPWGPARSLSLSSSPSEAGHISVTVRLTGSPFKEALKGMKPGDEAEVIGPLGDLLYDPSRNSVFIAGGIGITPFRGMMRFAADTGASRSIVLLYSARTPEEFAFRAELDALVRQHRQMEVRYTVTRPRESKMRWEGRTGRIDEPWVRSALDGMERPKVYVVGLPGMARDLLGVLRDRLGFAEEDLEYEYFMGY